MIRRFRKAFTLIELLTVIAIIALLVAMLMPSLSNARREGQSLKSITNLKQFGLYASMNSQEDSKNRLHTAHEVSNPWMGDGDHDWGGADGKDPEFSKSVVGTTNKGANGRFMNRMIFGQNITGQEDYSLFKNPGDDGMIFGLAQAGAKDMMYSRSVFEATGNSYMGDYYWFKSHQIPTAGHEYRRFGPFNRPVQWFADSGKNLLFWESRFIQAMSNTVETTDLAGLPYGHWGQAPVNVMGHHGKIGKFNAVFVDGHAGTITCRKKGDMIRPTQFQSPSNPNYWRLYWRGPDWAYDNLPRKLPTGPWLSPWTDQTRRVDFGVNDNGN